MPWARARRGSGSVPVHSLQNWAEQQGGNKTIFLPQHTMPASLCVWLFSPPNNLCRLLHRGTWCLLPEFGMNEWSKLEVKVLGEKKKQRHGELCIITPCLQPHTDPLSLQRSQWCSQTQTSSRSRALHKEYFGTNHHNNLMAYIFKVSFKH